MHKLVLSYEESCYVFPYFSFTRSVYEEIYPNRPQRVERQEKYFVQIIKSSNESKVFLGWLMKLVEFDR